jgi:hypothetical protein
LAFWQANEAIQALATRRWGGRCTTVTRYRYLHEVFLQGGKGALGVHGLEMTSVHAKTGEQLYHNSLITNHRLRTANVLEGAQAGRGRWKIAHENQHVLKTTGSHIEHHFGHGKQYLAALLLRLNRLAFLFHTVLEWGDDK